MIYIKAGITLDKFLAFGLDRPKAFCFYWIFERLTELIIEFEIMFAYIEASFEHRGLWVNLKKVIYEEQSKSFGHRRKWLCRKPFSRKAFGQKVSG